MPVAEETRRPVKGGHKNKQGIEATMNVAVRSHATTKQASEHFDVLIVGAGISGIGSAYHIEKQLPGTSYVILETQATFGGTWSTHRYPGIRSDSDLHTFGYSFKPWVGPPIATAEEILAYMNEVIDENDIARHIRYKHKINSASWSSEQNLWTIEATTTDTGEAKTFTANFLWMCQGYYRHSEGYTPEWKGMDRFKGRIVHPQSWPDDIDLANKKVVVIGSGATAATLVPNIADACAHVSAMFSTSVAAVAPEPITTTFLFVRSMSSGQVCGWTMRPLKRSVPFHSGV